MAQITNKKQLDQVNAAVQKGVAAGYDEATAQSMVRDKLASQGFSNEGGTLVKSTPTQNVTGTPQTPVQPTGVQPTTPQKIEANVGEAQTNALGSVFGSRSAYENAFGYQTRTPEEKAVLDRLYNEKITQGATNPTPEMTMRGTSVPLSNTEAAGQRIIATQNAQIQQEQAATTQYQKDIADLTSQKQAATQEQIAAEQTYAADVKARLEDQIRREELYSTQYTQLQQEQKDRAIQTLQPLVDKEKDVNAAALAKANADQEAAIYDAKIANDVAQQQAAVNFAKLGLSFSTAAVTTSQQIYQKGAYNIAKLKADGAYNIADLRLKGSQIEISHQLKVQDIIDSANEKILTQQKNSLDRISNIQNNITLTEKEKKESIKKLTDEFINFKKTSLAEVHKSMMDQNDRTNSKLETIRTQYDIIQNKNKEEANTMVATGRIFSMTDAQVNEVEQRAGMVPGTLKSLQRDTLFKGINAIVSKVPNLILPPEKLTSMFNTVAALVQSGMPMEQAIANIVLPVIKATPEYQTAKKNAELEAQYKLEGARLENVGKEKQIELMGKSIKEVGDQLYTVDQSTGEITKAQESAPGEIVDSGIKNVYGNNVKIKSSLVEPLSNAINELKANGIDLKIGDSYRSTATQAKAYASGKKGVAAPGTSFHEKGQAIDIAQNADNKKNIDAIKAALEAKGFRQHPGEWWHFSYGEFGGGATTTTTKTSETDKFSLMLKDYGSLGEKEKKIVDEAKAKMSEKELIDVEDYKSQLSQMGIQNPRVESSILQKNIEADRAEAKGDIKLATSLRQEADAMAAKYASPQFKNEVANVQYENTLSGTGGFKAAYEGDNETQAKQLLSSVINQKLNAIKGEGAADTLLKKAQVLQDAVLRLNEAFGEEDRFEYDNGKIIDTDGWNTTIFSLK